MISVCSHAHPCHKLSSLGFFGAENFLLVGVGEASFEGGERASGSQVQICAGGWQEGVGTLGEALGPEVLLSGKLGVKV